MDGGFEIAGVGVGGGQGVEHEAVAGLRKLGGPIGRGHRLLSVAELFVGAGGLEPCQAAVGVGAVGVQL